MAEPFAYLNGQFLPFSELSISVADAGFVFGATVSEYVRTIGGRLFRWDDHLVRLRDSARLCRIPLSASDEELKAAAEELVRKNQDTAYKTELALILFATPGPLIHLGGADTGPSVGMHTVPLPFGRYRGLFTDGAKLIVPSMRRDSTVDPRAKMRSRMNWWIAEQEVRQVDGDAWALLLNSDGLVTETAAANLLIVNNGHVFSPPRSSILNGVSLQVVEELCEEHGVQFVEQAITAADCESAEELMLTGTAFCLAGVSTFNGIPTPWPGPMFQRLSSLWSQHLGLNYVAQFVS